ncbi:S1 family peptidase [Cellulomonas marina]|uniref:Trypsin-like peptidase domain-containing protein n=1 Tax=Cellulomonas marina TaxID=988821 RepID=A0A1I0V3B2_9CELL|nr:serine protease [Cellulomonas marina]GIG28289.1 hypothetical protein Cma02nite_08890 [Cellulomonas marina]SFA70570.1 Trypsin-like peptidase domain-containing protein [Cellulomonas marina]
MTAIAGRRRTRRPLRTIGASVALAAGALSLAPAAVAATEPAPSSSASAGTSPTAAPGEETVEQLNARLEPSVVQLYIEWKGYVAFPTDEGSEWSDEITVPMICTGFFVSDVGQIATAGHCVDPVEGRHALIDAFLGSMVDEGWMTPDEAAGWIGTAYANWAVEGLDAGSDPQRIVYALQPEAVDGIAIEDPLAVQVVDFRAFEEGDVALLKADVTGTTPLPVAEADPASGMAVTSIGFPGSVQSVVDASRVRASFKTGSVSSQQISELGVPRTEINADLSGGMSGGPTVDALGNVVGVNSSKINGDQAFNFITDASDLHGWLTAHGVALAPLAVPAPEPTAEPVVAPQPAEPTEDEGLATWVLAAGGSGLLVLVGGIVLAVVLAGRRRPASAVALPGAATLTLPSGPSVVEPTAEFTPQHTALVGGAPVPAGAAPATAPATAYATPPAPAFAGAPAPAPYVAGGMAPVDEGGGSAELAPEAPGAGRSDVRPVGATAVLAPVPPAPSHGTGWVSEPTAQSRGTGWVSEPAAQVGGVPPAAPRTTGFVPAPAAGATCSACGAGTTSGQRFCSSCGGAL